MIWYFWRSSEDGRAMARMLSVTLQRGQGRREAETRSSDRKGLREESSYEFNKPGRVFLYKSYNMASILQHEKKSSILHF